MPSTTPNSAASGAIPSEGKIILDDGEYLVEVNVNCRQYAAPSFLQRRCAHSLHTPGGWECVRSFQLRPDQCWSAEVTTLPVDDDINCTELGRFDAILALWQRRREAYCRHAR